MPGVQVLEKAVAMLKSIMAKIAKCAAGKAAGADDPELRADLDKLRSGNSAMGRWLV